VTSYSFDSDGRPSSVEDAMGHTQTTAFTVDGQTASVEDNLSNTTAYAYGHGGELLTTTDALSHSTGDEYDSSYRLVQTTDANAGVTRITLDPAGNRTAMVDSASNETDWTFNALNRPVTETNSGGTTTISYDAASDITKIVDADGRDRVFGYDALHRLTAENWMSGSTLVASTAYSYDAANQLVLASDGNSSYAFAYNGDGNVLTTDNAGTPNVPHVVLTGAFDAAGNRTSLSATIAGTADLLNSYSYDADQRMTMLTQQGQTGGNVVSPKEVDFAYNALGQFTSIADFNTLSGPRSDVATGAYSYDADNRLIGLAYTSNAGATTIDAFGWSYNAGNLVTGFTSNDGTAGYSYDATNQLTAASYTTATGGHQPANESYSFDANGNRDSTGYSTAAGNLMTSDGTFNYTHDADGNTTSRTRISSATASDYLTTYTWDYRNRLTDVEYYDNSSVLTKHVHYVYDVFDHLLSTQVDTTGSGSYNQVEYYVLDVSPEIPAAGVPGTALAKPLLQFDGSGNLTTRYLEEAVDQIFAQGAVSSLTSGDTVNWDLVDNLGSVRYVLDNIGNAIDELVYNSFGVVAYESDPTVAHFAGFAGGHADQNSGLVIFYHRPYAPTTGGWLTPDPDGFKAEDANLGRYVGNSPVSHVDHLGLMDAQQQALYAKWVRLQTLKAAVNQYQAALSTINKDITSEVKWNDKLTAKAALLQQRAATGLGREYDLEYTNQGGGSEVQLTLTGTLPLPFGFIPLTRRQKERLVGEIAGLNNSLGSSSQRMNILQARKQNVGYLLTAALQALQAAQ
jgi:RHS repeat-associated protein